MIITNIKATNFLSFESLDYDLPNSPILVQGVNLTDDNQESNGSGKSVVQNAIEFALLSSNSRKERDVNMIRRGESSASVEIAIKCDIRKETLIIKREIKKAGSKLELYINDNDNPVTFSTVRDGNDFILKWLDLSKDDVTSYYVINQERFKSFFTSSNKEKLDLISRLADTYVLDSVEPLIKDDLSVVEEEIKRIDNLITKEEGKIDSYNQDLEALNVSDDNLVIVEEKVAKIEAEVSRIESNILDLRKNKEEVEFNTESGRLTKSSLEKELITIPDVSDQLSSLSNKSNDILNSIKEGKKMMADIELNLRGKVECPKCHHEFIAKDGVDVEEETELFKEAEKIVNDLEKELSEIDEEILSIMKLDSERRDINNNISECDKQITRLSNESQSIDLRIKRLESDVREKKIEIQSIKSKELPNNEKKIEELNLKIDVAKSAINDFNKEKEILENEAFEIEQWVTNFKRFKLYVANNAIQSIQTRCNTNLSKMNSDLRVAIDGFKIKADGKIKEEITPMVVRDLPASFFSYSGGEKGKVQFAMILAIQELINSTNKYGGLKFLRTTHVQHVRHNKNYYLYSLS